MRVIVVVDTNQYHGDPTMAKRNFRIVLGQHERDRFEVVVPEVIAREVAKLYRREYENARNKFASGAKKLRDLGHDPGDFELPNPDDATESFARRFREHLADRGVEIVGAPNVSVDDLLEDSLAERRPFRSEGRGFRDVVIWRTVRELADRDGVVLVSDNWKDFAEDGASADVLHPHLRDDLERDGHEPERVRLVPSLEGFIDEYVPSAEQQLHLALQLLEDDEAWRSSLYYEAERALYRFEPDMGDSVTIVESENASPDNIGVDDVGVEGIEIADAYETGDEDVVSLELRVRAVLNFTFTVEPGEAEWLVEERADMQIDIWEETFAQGSTMGRPVEVTFAADFNPQTGEVSNFEKVIAIDAPAE